MALDNPWITYIQRSYQQTKAAIIEKLKNPITGIPEITDHSEGNIFIKMISIWSGLMEMVGYYLDNRARETFLLVQRRFQSAARLAKQYDYRIRGASAATVDLKFTLNAIAGIDVTIPEGTEVQTKSGVRFFTVAELIITAGLLEGEVSGKQWVQVVASVVAVGDGTIDQVHELEDGIIDGSVEVAVDVIDYAPQDTFGFSEFDDPHFIAGLNTDANMQVLFGDGINGKVPDTGLDISIGYYTSSGLGGNVAANTITEIIDTITAPVGISVSVTNGNPASGGADQEGLIKLQRNIPISLRTRYRAVTRQDYIEVAILALGVSKAGLIFDCGKTVDVYIVPDGGGDASQALLDATQIWLDERKMVTTEIRMFSAGEVTILYGITIYILKNFSITLVSQAVKDALVEFHSTDNQDVSGAIFLGDVYQVVEGVDGIDKSEVMIMSPVPEALPSTPTTPALVWERTLQDGNTETIEWKIQFTTTSLFNLHRDNIFIGSFPINTVIAQPEIIIKIIGTYTAGNIWTFKTYNTFGTIILDEPSIAITSDSDITLKTIGGF